MNISQRTKKVIEIILACLLTISIGTFLPTSANAAPNLVIMKTYPYFDSQLGDVHWHYTTGHNYHTSYHWVEGRDKYGNYRQQEGPWMPAEQRSTAGFLPVAYEQKASHGGFL